MGASSSSRPERRGRFLALIFIAVFAGCLSAKPGTDRAESSADSGSGPSSDGGRGSDTGADGGTAISDGGPGGDGATGLAGQISVNEVSYVNVTPLGQGLEVDIRFTEARVPLYEEQPGSTEGCKAYEYSLATTPPPAPLDEGTVTITSDDGSPVFPACVHEGASGYSCPSSMGTGGRIARVSAEAFRFDPVPDSSPWTEDDLGRYLEVAGSTVAANNGRFPIILVPAANSIWFYNPRAQGETLPTSARWVVRAGGGPIPNLADPGMLDDIDQLTIALAAGGRGDFSSFSSIVEVGDDLRLDPSSAFRVANVPLDGSSFSLTCSTCGTSDATLISITTTDGAIPAGSASSFMPAIASKGVLVRCLRIGETSVTVPAEASQLIRRSGATRIRTDFVRAGIRSPQSTNPVSIVAGHAVVGFTDRGSVFCGHNPFECAPHQLTDATRCTCMEACDTGFTWDPGSQSCI